jgi:hypothetical protein
VGEVSCAIKRINHPFVTGWRLFGQSTFLGKDRMGWECRADDIDDPLLCLVVGVRDKINNLLMFNPKAGAYAFH